MPGDGAIQNITKDFGKLSMHKLEEIAREARKEIRVRYRHNRKSKLGKLSKYIPWNRWRAIMNSIKSQKYVFLFYVMRRLALRIGEVVSINIKDIDHEMQQLRIWTEKAQQWDFLELDDSTYNLLRKWMLSNSKLINSHNGYIFFPEPRSHSKREFISPDKTRTIFREACKSAAVQVVYGEADSTGYDLNLYTTHSCRHSGITDFYAHTKDVRLTQTFARHEDIKSTIGYIHLNRDDIRTAMQEINKKQEIQYEQIGMPLAQFI